MSTRRVAVSECIDAVAERGAAFAVDIRCLYASPSANAKTLS